MRFEQFQATRQWCDDLTKHFPDDVMPGSRGWLYCGDQLWIEDTATWTKEAPGYGQGRWYTRVGNQEYQSDNLDDCEQPLSEFAESGGHLGDPK